MSTRPDSRRLTYAERQRLAKRRGLPLPGRCHGRPGYQLVPGHCDAWPMRNMQTLSRRRANLPMTESRIEEIHGEGHSRELLHWIYLIYACRWKMSHGGTHISHRILHARMAALHWDGFAEHGQNPGDMHPAEIPQHICAEQGRAQCSTVRELERLWIEQQAGGAS